MRELRAARIHTLDSLARLLWPLAPPRCVACGAGCPSRELLCARCEAALLAARPPELTPVAGLDLAWAAAAHDGVARQLVAALKFGRLLAVADLIAARIVAAAPPHLLAGTVVAVPPAPLRHLQRGFDPAAEIAARLARRLGVPSSPCLARRSGRRQVGRPRAARLASPPRVCAVGPAPPLVLLVDDVQTTGATLSACAAALRRAGAKRISAVTFARTL
jgi:predicted amidophosphoribosyltransferase